VAGAPEADAVIAVLDYGIGNLASAAKALRATGADAVLTGDPDEAAVADGIVVPGVGAFGPAVHALRSRGLDDAVRDALGRGRPVLGICVGFQLLYEGSEEDPGYEGLGVLQGVVRRLPDGVKRPQMQWNRLVAVPGRGEDLVSVGLAEGDWVYFVHSFSPPVGEETVAVCDYGGELSALVVRAGLWATQFHPEKSGATGLRLLRAFATMAERQAEVRQACS
jgi:glutamine amidotransferase